MINENHFDFSYYKEPNYYIWKQKLLPGNYYFVNLGQTYLIGRFKTMDRVSITFYDLVHFALGGEFYKVLTAYCLINSIEEIRLANNIEKQKLLEYEIKNNITT